MDEDKRVRSIGAHSSSFNLSESKDDSWFNVVTSRHYLSLCLGGNSDGVSRDEESGEGGDDCCKLHF